MVTPIRLSMEISKSAEQCIKGYLQNLRKSQLVESEERVRAGETSSSVG